MNIFFSTNQADGILVCVVVLDKSNFNWIIYSFVVGKCFVKLFFDIFDFTLLPFVVACSHHRGFDFNQ